MNDQVYANFENLSSQAGQIKTCSSNMDAAFDNFIAAMKEIGEDTEVLFGVSAESLMEQFKDLKSRFSLYTERVDKLVEVINETSQSTQETDETLSNMTEELNDQAII